MPEGVVQIWDASLFVMDKNAEPLLDLIGLTDDVRHASWNGDGSRIVTISKDGSVQLWDAESGEGLTLLRMEEGRGLYSEWSEPGDGLLVVYREGVYVWDVPVEEAVVDPKN